MITIYVSPSCSSCRKVKKWFDEQQIPYKEKNIFTADLKADELKDILIKTENGTEDIIATKSKIMKENKVNIDDMKISEMIDFVRKNPSVLKRPIIVDDSKDSIQVGYNPDDITLFIPPARKLVTIPCTGNCEDKLKKEAKFENKK